MEKENNIGASRSLASGLVVGAGVKARGEWEPGSNNSIMEIE